ncbi:MAG: SDR family NAD(P)-dependent oxidoreductase [Alphaproteobacteria bacterium]|nr:SDR family NAD(P)-dependent oxidoreductase [Alphaproteobacteria bacterium]
MTIQFRDRVVIVTGAGGGLGREHALQFAARGARVVVNDFGGSVDGAGGSSLPAERVAEEILAAGGEAIAHGANVADPDHVADMVDKTMARWGRIDVLVNNAGILRDATFANMTPQSFRAVLDVHLFGSAICSLAVWPHMRKAAYGRIMMTSSTSGLYGNFGQSNYAAAKMGLVGLMNVLHLEGRKYGIRVNTLAPAALTRMTEKLTPPALQDLMKTSAVSPAVLFLSCEDAPSRCILAAGAGGYSRLFVVESEGIHLPEGARTPEALRDRFDEISDKTVLHEYEDVSGQSLKFITRAAAEAGLDLKSLLGV